MSLSNELLQRSGKKCELCGAKENLDAYTVPPKTGNHDDDLIAVCDVCLGQLTHAEPMDANHWRCLNESIWSTVPAVQVASYRMLHQLQDAEWTQDLLSIIYLDEATLEWAQQGLQNEDVAVHRDANGQVLESGDTVVLIKDLDVKGANFIAKRGTAVRRINLVKDNPEHIEGKVNDQQIVILTKFVKKS